MFGDKEMFERHCRQGINCFVSHLVLNWYFTHQLWFLAFWFSKIFIIYMKDGSALSHESTNTTIIRTSSLELSIAHFHVCHLGRSSSYLEPLANPHEFTLDLRKDQNQNISKFKNAISAEVFQTNGRIRDFFKQPQASSSPKILR